MEAPGAVPENLCMGRTVKKPAKPGHHLRQWRKSKKYSLEKVTDLVRELAVKRFPSDKRGRTFKKLGATHGNLSRIERGEVPYNQVLLELLAEVYGTDTGSLLNRNPEDPVGIWSIWEKIAPQQRPHAADVLRTFTEKTRNS